MPAASGIPPVVPQMKLPVPQFPDPPRLAQPFRPWFLWPVMLYWLPMKILPSSLNRHYSLCSVMTALHLAPTVTSTGMEFTSKRHTVWVIDQAWGQDGRILALFLICKFMDLDSVSVHKHTKKGPGKYPAILTKLAWHRGPALLSITCNIILKLQTELYHKLISHLLLISVIFPAEISKKLYKESSAIWQPQA